MAFLYDIFKPSFVRTAISQIELPNSITDNLKLEIRPYQVESFRRFIFVAQNDLEEVKKPYHLLYNMATGSGKTMVMAGLMTYLYQKGYRNFLFFVNSNNIITKTKDNFLNTQSSKYLFKEKIQIEGKEVFLKEVSNFDEADNENINIKFTTIQQLHIDLNNTKENSITFEDFQSRKLCLIADEAHHLSSGTKSGTLFGSWEGTVLEILNQNLDNILLEFTATLDYDSREIVNKYQDKVIYKYDLKEFRADKYSKEISLIRSMFNEEDRIIQALIISTYRQEIAVKNHINLKPVILFKAKKTIAESEKNKENFHLLIESLSAEQIENVFENSTISSIKKAKQFFYNQNITIEQLTQKIKNNFREENCLSANESDTQDKKKREAGLKSDQLLNTLEENGNPIRAIFAVQKLNEGWDVLNLFDIVRLYEGQNTGGSNTKIGATTISEAQLIGRGARYYPFRLDENQDKYKRKFDNDTANDLKVLEEMYYHSKDEPKYISELKKALIETGIYEDEDNLITKQLELKFEFKETDFYKEGQVFYNKKKEKDFGTVNSLYDLGVKKRNIVFELSSGIGKTSSVFDFELEATDSNDTVIKQKDISLKTISFHIVRFALTQNPFFYYDNLIKYFPNMISIKSFINSENYLASLSITFKGIQKRLENISNKEFLSAVTLLLQSIEHELKNNVTKYEGSNFVNDYVHKVFTDKQLKINKYDVRADGQETFVANESWYAYNANYGTTEEKDFVELFARKFEDINKKYDNIFLLRNERQLFIFDKQGRRFEPDFVLFCKQKAGDGISYQVFIEPKGQHLIKNDQWKEDFLIELRTKKDILTIHSDKFLITGVPFYNSNKQNDFYKNLEEILTE
jgi:type III restriction enzyme